MGKKKTAAKKRKKLKKQNKRTQMAGKKATHRVKVAAKAKAAAHKTLARRGRKSSAANRTTPAGSQSVDTVRVKPKSRVARAGASGGDLQGISVVEDVDSESAAELLEEGQAFEAGIVSGVENARDADEGEVTTHEVPQDDVPGEYDHKDRQ